MGMKSDLEVDIEELWYLFSESLDGQCCLADEFIRGRC